MAYNNGREDRKWRIWKEAEEKVLREHGVDEATIEQIRIDDRADFNSNRRFYHWTSDFGEYLEGIGIARVVFQRAGTKFRYVTLVVLQDRAHGGCVAVCRCGNDRERQQIFRLPNGIHHLLFPPNTV